MIQLTALNRQIGQFEDFPEVNLGGLSTAFVSEMFKEMRKGNTKVSIKTLLNRCKHLEMKEIEYIRLFSILVERHLVSHVQFFISMLKYCILNKPDEVKTIFFHAVSYAVNERDGNNDFLAAFLVKHLNRSAKGDENSQKIVHFFIEHPIMLKPAYQSLDVMYGLIAHGAAVDNVSFFGTSFLRWSLDCHLIPVFESLLKKTGHISTLFSPKPIPNLIRYLQKKFNIKENLTAVDCIYKLLEMDVAINFNECLNGSLLEKAIAAQDINFAQVVINHGADPNARRFDGRTPLHQVCNITFGDQALQLEFITLLLEKGADIHLKTQDHESSVLHLLCYNQASILSIEYILKQGLQVDVVDKHGFTPFDYVFQAENIPLMLKLLEYGTKAIDKHTNADFINMLDQQKNIELLEKLLARGFDINSTGSDKQTLLWKASNQRNLIWVKYLVRKGADVNALSRTGLSPLMMAINTDIQITTCLVENNARLFVVCDNGMSALDYLLRMDLPHIIAYFVERFLDVSALEAVQPLTATKKGIKDFVKAVTETLGTSREPLDLFPFLMFSILFNIGNMSAKILQVATNIHRKEMIVRLFRCFPELLDNIPYLMEHFMILKSEHLVVKSLEITLPPAPSEAKIEELVRLFNEINFTDNTKPNYVNPSKITNDFSEVISIEELGANLRKLMDYIHNQTPYVGTPKADTQDLLMFYERLEIYLKHISVQLCKMENTHERSYHVINLAVASCYCGQRWLGEAYNKFKLLFYPNHFPTLPDQIYHELTQVRSDLVHYISGDDVHDYNHAIRVLGAPLGIPGSDGIADLNDPIIPLNRLSTFKDLCYLFFKVYHAHRIYTVVEDFLNLMLKKQPELIHPWMTENIPKEWRAEFFTELNASLHKTERQVDKYNAVMAKFGIPPLKKVDEFEEHLKNYKISTYMDEDFYDFKANCLTINTIMTVLKKLHILTECHWGIYQEVLQVADQEKRARISNSLA